MELLPSVTQCFNWELKIKKHAHEYEDNTPLVLGAHVSSHKYFKTNVCGKMFQYSN